YNGLLRAVVEEPDSQSGSSFAATVVELGSRRRRYFALTTSALLDRERRAEHRLLLSVCDRGRPPLCSGPPLRALVRLADVNDNPPVFAEAHAAALVTLAEDAPPGAEVYALKAADPDAGANGTVSYRFADPVDAAVAAAFELNSTTGRLQVGAGGLRAAAGGVAALELTLLAEDGGQPPLDARLNLRVELADVNDQRPLFRTTNRDQPGQLTLSIPELLPAGSVLTTLIATDGDSGDNGRVSYRLRGLPFALETFAISRRTGCLRLRRRLTAAAAPYRLFAVAFDHGRPAPRESVLYLLVLVTAGRPAPLSAEASLLLQFARPAYDFEVAEGLPAGQSVGQVVAAADDVTDPDAVADYKILGGSRLFAIDSGGFSFWLFASTRRGWRADRLAAKKPGDAIRCESRSRPAAAKTQQLEPLRCQLFYCNRMRGEIRTLAPLDRERHPRGLWLTVAASAAAPAATCEIHVTILDVNDCRPVASDRAHYRLLLAEGALPGIELLTAIPAEDCDSDPANGRRSGLCKAGRLTTTNVTIDREASDRFELVVSLTDQGSPALTSPVLIEIQVLDINDSPPSFLERQFSFAAFDGAPDDWENLPD
uniref:Cadherin domain-containing protein n=1 Tax=Macrostomum lignano TaxID=282301 RepID=A0A1I8FXU3_9PLAT